MLYSVAIIMGGLIIAAIITIVAVATTHFMSGKDGKEAGTLGMEPFTSKEEFNKYVMLYGEENLPPIYRISEVASFDGWQY